MRICIRHQRPQGHRRHRLPSRTKFARLDEAGRETWQQATGFTPGTEDGKARIKACFILPVNFSRHGRCSDWSGAVPGRA